MFTEEEFMIHIYCLVTEYMNRLFLHRVRRAGYAPAFTDAEALTLEIVGEYLSLPGERAIYQYFKKHYRAWFPALPDRTQLVRQWHNLWRVKEALWQALIRDSGASTAAIHVIDTVPIPVCHPKRAPYRGVFLDTFLDEPTYGYCASKDWHYFGLKGGLRIAANGMIVAAPMLAAAPHDSRWVEPLLEGVPRTTTVYGDKGFIDLTEQQQLKERHWVVLKTPLRHNMTGREEFRLHRLEAQIRRRIETVIGQLTERFQLQRLKVRKGWTFASKWFAKILTHTICVFTNLQHGKSPTQLAALVHD